MNWISAESIHSGNVVTVCAQYMVKCVLMYVSACIVLVLTVFLKHAVWWPVGDYSTHNTLLCLFGVLLDKISFKLKSLQETKKHLEREYHTVKFWWQM